MMQIIRFVTRSLGVAGVLVGLAVATASPVLASLPPPDPVPRPGGGGVDVNTSAQQAACEGSGGVWSGTACTTPGNSRTVASTIRDVANILIFIVGAVAVLMIIVGGLRYTFAQGDNAAITAAKNTVLYAVVGVVIAVAAYGIVSFVTSTIK